MMSRLLKVEAAGNDFLLGLGEWSERLATEPVLVTRLCDRRRGIGGDGALAVFPTTTARARVVYRNADGSMGAFCANGTRAAARACHEVLGLDDSLTLETGWCDIEARVKGAIVSLELPAPDRAPTPVILEVEGQCRTGVLVHIGVPHLVVPVAGLDTWPVEREGPVLRRHPALGDAGANVNFIAPDGPGRLAIRTFERGVEGETLACGSGAVAASLVVMAEQGLSAAECRPRSGSLLRVEAHGEPPLCRTRLTGPARLVAEVKPSDELISGAFAPTW